MPTLFNKVERAAILARLDKLTADTPRRWGTMTSAQMVAHCADVLRLALGDVQLPPRKMILANPLIRFFVIRMPVPKNLPTGREMMTDKRVVDLETERQAMRELLERFGRCSPSGPWAVHPAFGAMSGKEWGIQQWGHINHHFKQFGL